MNVGTKSLLFGVHQFLWHPITVLLAWKRVHGHWPAWPIWICIALHDIGYWGCPDMDGPCGKLHPIRGAAWSAAIIGKLRQIHLWSLLPAVALRHPIFTIEGILEDPKYWIRTVRWAIRADAARMGIAYGLLVRYHSRSLAKAEGAPVSPLCDPDKISILFDPHWFYVLRAWLSGEGEEFAKNAEHKIGIQPLHVWASWYREHVRKAYAKGTPDSVYYNRPDGV